MKARQSKKAKELFNDEKIGRAIIRKIQTSTKNNGVHLDTIFEESNLKIRIREL